MHACELKSSLVPDLNDQLAIRSGGSVNADLGRNVGELTLLLKSIKRRAEKYYLL
jgi:hypothetical protein